MKHPITLYRERHGLTLARMGELFSATKSTVLKWEHGNGPSPRRAIRLERESKGEFPRWFFRPDLWPPPKGAAE